MSVTTTDVPERKTIVLLTHYQVGNECIAFWRLDGIPLMVRMYHTIRHRFSHDTIWITIPIHQARYFHKECFRWLFMDRDRLHFLVLPSVLIVDHSFSNHVQDMGGMVWSPTMYTTVLEQLQTLSPVTSNHHLVLFWDCRYAHMPEIVFDPSTYHEYPSHPHGLYVAVRISTHTWFTRWSYVLLHPCELVQMDQDSLACFLGYLWWIFHADKNNKQTLRYSPHLICLKMSLYDDGIPPYLSMPIESLEALAYIDSEMIHRRYRQLLSQYTTLWRSYQRLMEGNR